jgi:anhydro-N-acetylmuramic acid kinase
MLAEGTTTMPGISAAARIVLGAMSGTSADGVDVVVARISGSSLDMRARILASASVSFSKAVREHIQTIRNAGHCALCELAELGRHVTLAYARASLAAMRKADVTAADVACIAAHGQTLFHAPPLTIQWFDPALLAARTGCTVVSDFRRADCALGGQGAPLVPFADYLLFRDRRATRVLLNLGGIANITFLPAGGSLDDVVAFDTGPGNCISDYLARKHTDRPHDQGGKRAAAGTPDDEGADQFLSHPYFHRDPPKSTDGPEMLAVWNAILRLRALRGNDQLATACLITARAVAMAIRHQLPQPADEIVVAGGGVRNRTLLRMLAQQTGLPVRTTDDLGVPAQAREALAFAILGAATLDRVPANVPSVTGASRPVVLGSITSAA